MSYSETVNYLYNLQKYGIKFGLENIQRLMSSLDNPHKAFRFVHVAGTNGKGSTSAMIASLLKKTGLKVGLFTSPHLVSFTERIRVNGDEITENEVISLASHIKKVVEKIEDFSPTFFETVTAMAILYFKEKKIDIAVMEVGMGGRLDATNIILPEVSVITSISFDHREFLGDSLEDIAREKAGIIKKGIPVVTARQEIPADKLIKKTADLMGSPLYIYGRDFGGLIRASDIRGITMKYFDNITSIDDIFIPLAGEHQLINSCIAIKSVLLLTEKLKRNLLLSSVKQAFCDLKWPGRLEFIAADPPVLIDGAHNPSAAKALSDTLKTTFKNRFKKIIMILGVMADKDISGIMEPLLPLADEIIFTTPAYSRAASPEKLKQVAKSLGFSNMQTAQTVKDAIETATQLALRKQNPLIMITGSFYTIGEAKEVLGQKGVLTNLRE
ncbi:MAG: bifunctional folylpolyglutamate synthase/dihydrofolate synthase [Nitrospirae bacterium]|nr:bifunctional folylpolyglutamate synthase/dihydrofolate synthase [Nitrospirota bacterium]